MKPSILKFAGFNALGTLLYIAVVASTVFYAPRLFGGDGEDTVLIPIAMLLLFVVSASVTALLVVGRPVLWYLEGKKREAFSLVSATLGILLLLTICAFLGLAAIART